MASDQEPDDCIYLPLPEEEEFEDVDEAVRYLYRFAMDHGFAVSKSNVKKDRKGYNRRHDFRCAKGGKVRGKGVKRSTGSRMTECPFTVRIHRTGYGTWKVQQHSKHHNHEASEPSAFPRYRLPTDAQMALIRSSHANGTAPRFIFAQILEGDPQTLISLRDIYNEVARMRKERLAGLTPIETLIMELRDSDRWAHRYRTDDAGHVNFFFFAPFDAIDLARRCPDVIFIDATYRTNRYNMPLVHFMAVTPIGTTTSIGMCFVASETEQMYLWAVEAFKELVMDGARIRVFLSDDEQALKNALSVTYSEVVQLLCVWHVNKNVEAAISDRWVRRSEGYDSLTLDERTKEIEKNKERRKNLLADWVEVSVKHSAYRVFRCDQFEHFDGF
jgi:MULE transposase domain/FAR1 DNA-binding domain